MKKEKIYECEVKRLHQLDGQRFWKWITKQACDVLKSDQIRCCTCKGKVRLHKQKSPAGPSDHVEHIRKKDSEGCPKGFYFNGTSQISKFPVD